MKIELTQENLLAAEHALNLVMEAIDEAPETMTELYEISMEPEDINLKIIREKAHNALLAICRNFK